MMWRWIGYAVLLAGCISETDVTPRGEPYRHAGTLDKIVYINPLPNDQYWDLLGTCLADEARKYGIAVDEKGPPGGNVDLQATANLLSQAVAAKEQAIVTWPASPASFDVQFEKARAQGSLVVALGEGTDQESFQVSDLLTERMRSYVEAAAKRPGHHTIGAILQTDHGWGKEAAEALKDAVKRHRNLTLAEVQFNDGQFTDDIAITKRMMAAHPQIDILMNYSGFPGMYTAIKELKLHGKVHTYSPANFREAMLEYIDQGLVAGVYVTDRCNEGHQIVRGLRAAWAGKHVPDSGGGKVISPEEYRDLPDGWM